MKPSTDCAPRAAFEIAHDFAQRNLHLLRAINDTLESLGADAAFFTALAKEIERFDEFLRSEQPSVRVDADGRVVGSLEEAIRICERMHDVLSRKRVAAQGDPQLREEDGVVDAFDDCLDAVAQLHHATTDLREWIITHDAILEAPLPGTFDSVDDLLHALDAQA